MAQSTNANPALLQELSVIDAGARRVIDFWLEAGPPKWFAKDEAFDADFRQRFYDLHFAVARREKEAWLEAAYSALAAVILLDQYPRNAFRDTAHMFATDPLALSYSRKILASGQIMAIQPDLRGFVCLPFMHSEVLADQEEALKLYAEHAPQSMKWAIEHHQIIERFGRFPHRNPALARKTTPAEQRFLDSGGFAG